MIPSQKMNPVGLPIFKFETYHPKPKQLAFHQSKAKYKAMVGAFRSGKTYAACYEAISLSLKYPGNVGLISRKDYTTLRDSTMQTFFSIIPKDSPMVEKWNETTHDLLLKTNGKPSLIMFRGADEYQRFGSYELGWFWIDQAEERGIVEDVFKMLQSRLSKRGVPLCGMLTPNPPNQFHWIYKRFRNADPKEYFTIHTSTYDNKEYLPDGYIEELEKQPENWKKMYLYGDYGFMAEGDPVYADFRENLHITKEPLIPDKHAPIVRSWDFGYRFPACGWYQYLSSKDRVQKLAELMIPDIPVDLFADMVIQKSYEKFGRISFEDVGDPAGNQKGDKSERTSIEILASKGITVTTQPTFVKDGLNLIRRNLLVRDDGKPGYILDPSCQLTQEAYLGGYFLKESSDIPDDKCHPYCDIADTDRYYFVNRVSISKPFERREYYDQPETRRHGVTGY